MNHIYWAVYLVFSYSATSTLIVWLWFGFFFFSFFIASFLILTLKKWLEQNIFDFFLKLTEGLLCIFNLWVSLTVAETFGRTWFPLDFPTKVLQLRYVCLHCFLYRLSFVRCGRQKDSVVLCRTCSCFLHLLVFRLEAPRELWGITKPFSRSVRPVQ